MPPGMPHASSLKWSPKIEQHKKLTEKNLPRQLECHGTFAGFQQGALTGEMAELDPVTGTFPVIPYHGNQTQYHHEQQPHTQKGRNFHAEKRDCGQQVQTSQSPESQGRVVNLDGHAADGL